ncbi:MAG: PhoU domain-containing protein, partial [Anaerolineales bacterium]
MGYLVDDGIERAMQALITQDSDLAQQVINDDAVVN